MNNADSDRELLNQAIGGDTASLAELLVRHGPPLRRRLDINPKWQSVLDPLDVLQVTYLEAYEQIGRFSGDADSFPRWLRRIAENNLRDAIQALERDKRPQPDRRISGGGEDAGVAWLFELISGAVTTPSRSASGKELRSLLETEVASLPADYATVLQGIYFEGNSIGEMAEAMGRTRGAIHLLRHRAIATLRRRLGSGSRFLSYH